MTVATAGRPRNANSSKKESAYQMTDQDMRQSVTDLFCDSQHHVSSHRKNVHQLRQVHLEWCREGGAEREEAFFLVFLQCLNLVLAVKKNEEVVGRMMRFIVGFVVLSADKGTKDWFSLLFNTLTDEEGKNGATTVTSRFIENLMLYALEGVDAKEKSVRARLCQLLVACVNSVDELGDHVWTAFRGKMVERLFDREAIVRVHAVHAMARLQALPIDEEGSGGLEVLDIFMDLLQHDPAYEVRKAVLSQIDVTPRSLPIVLGRRRDIDVRIRRAFFTEKLAEIDMRTLSIEQRDAVLRAGLTDRETSVKQACIDMIFRNWIHDANSNLVEFLACLDVQNNTKMSEGALEAFFDGHPEESIAEAFGPAYFENLTVETAFILRVYCQWRAAKDGAAVVQEVLPEIVQMAAYIRRAYETLLGCCGDEQAAGMRAEVEFVLGELLLVCRLLDWSDEVGRRVLADALLELLTNLELGDSLFTSALSLLILQSPSSQDYYDLVVGLVADFRDVFEDPSQDEQQMTPEELTLKRSMEGLTLAEGTVLPEEVRILARLRCLELIREALRLAVSIEEDALLPTALTEVVIPAVNSSYAAVQAAGLLCLGLACSLSRELTAEYLNLFLDFFRLGSDETAIEALRIAFDLLFLFGLPAEDGSSGVSGSQALDTLCMALYDPRPTIQALAAEGFAKLLLHGILKDNGILEGLLQLAYHPQTANEPRLRQCLAYFLPAFAFSRPAHQMALASVALPLLRSYDRDKQSASSGLSVADVAAQLAHLTDPDNLVKKDSHDDSDEPADAIGPHDLLAMEALWTLIEHPTGPLTRALLNLLPRLRLPSFKPLTIKKLVFLTAQLSKIVVHDRATLPTVKKLLAGLVELDDVETVISAEDLAVMKERLSKYLPVSDSLAIPASIARMKSASSKPKATASDDQPVDNILDDLDDILE